MVGDFLELKRMRGVLCKMIARNRTSELEDKAKVLLLVPYYGHSTVRSLLKDIDRGRASVVTYLFNETKGDSGNFEEPDVTEYVSSYSEDRNAFDISPEHERAHVRDLMGVVRSEGIDVMIPTKEKYVSFLARNSHIFGDKLFLPSEEVVDVLQDKANGYDFFKVRGVSVPDFVRFKHGDLSGLKTLLSKHGSVFVKPSNESGGKRAYEVGSVDQFRELYGEDSGELLACEVLNLPEFNHTALIQDGSIQVQATYECPGSTKLGAYPRKVFEDPRIDAFAEQICDTLVAEYGVVDSQGVYNIDFLTRDNGDYVLSEVNVGRLPGGHGIFTPYGLNFSNSIVDCTLKDSRIRTTTYQ